MADAMPIQQIDAFTGCLLGGAVGDALGAPIEFMSRSEILHRFGERGVTEYVPAYGGLGRITDDTQMTLFTADGLIRTAVRMTHKGIATAVGVTGHAYLRWLMTQSETPAPEAVFGMEKPGWLFRLAELHARRAPGFTCLSALRQMKHLGDPAFNDSKGCGGVMRMAPLGLWMAGTSDADADIECMELGCKLAGLTHGHPTGQYPAGAFAVVIRRLASGQSVADGIAAALAAMEARGHHEQSLETRRAIEQAVSLAEKTNRSGCTDAQHALHLASLGEGWVAEEALAISLYCALVAQSFEHGIGLSINHSGDSDSTGAITGNLLGCRHGLATIPGRWLTPLELSTPIAEMARDLCHFGTADWRDPALPDIDADAVWERYPGY